MTDLVDTTRDLRALAELAAHPTRLDDVLRLALASLRPVVPYDLAAVYVIEGDRAAVRATDGPLADARVAAHTLDLRRFPTVRRALATRRPVALEAHHHQSDEGDPYDGILDLPPGHSCMVVPLYSGDRTLGLITFDRAVCHVYPDETLMLAGVYGQIVSLAMLFAEQAALLDRVRRQAEERSRVLQAEAGPTDAVRLLEGTRAPAMAELLRLARLVAATDTPVLVRGETGTGKELLARALHAWSRRAEGPFVTLNSAALPPDLVESELFGHVKGAFSGATRDRPGRFMAANGGTLLLDEIGDMAPGAQARLLRVLQEGTFEPVGSDRTVKVDVRVVAATHVDLEQAVQAGRFREDLYYRLAVFPLTVPPLRARLEDVPMIAEALLARRTGAHRGPWRLGPAAVEALRRRPWPGNVRELVNAVERATIVCPRGELGPDDFGVAPVVDAAAPRAQPASGRFVSFADNERRHLEAALARAEGRIYGEGGAAELLGLKPTTLQSKLKKHGLK